MNYTPLEDVIDSLPELKPPGLGHNQSLVGVARACRNENVSPEETYSYVDGQYEAHRDRSAIDRSIAKVWGSEEPQGATSNDWSYVEGSLRAFKPTSTESLLGRSPTNPEGLTPQVIIKKLFKPRDLLNVQRTGLEGGNLFLAAQLAKRLSLDNWKFLGSQVFGEKGGVPNKAAKSGFSTRCDDNVLERAYLVAECDMDSDSVERFSTFMLGVREFLPVVMVVDTGGKSLHWWMECRGRDWEDVLEVYKVLVKFGSDPQLKALSQVTRMPSVSAAAEDRGPQQVVYWDPAGKKFPEPDKLWSLDGLKESLKSIEPALPTPKFYAHGGKYLFQNSNGGWSALDKTSLKTHLALSGFPAYVEKGDIVSDADAERTRIEREDQIDGIVEAASGRWAGLHDVNGLKILVCRSPQLPLAEEGSWENTEMLMRQMTSGEEGYQILLGWLQGTVKSLHTNVAPAGQPRRAFMSQAQMLHLVGPSNCGKSLLLKHSIKPLISGRMTEADALFEEKGNTFNAAAAGCELLYLDDSPVIKDGHSYRHLQGELIKFHTTSSSGSIHAKFKEPVELDLFKRIMRLMNDEPKTLNTIPFNEPGCQDKIIVIRCRSMKGGEIIIDTPEKKQAFELALQGEAPHLLHYLLHEHVVPPQYADPEGRFHVLAYKDQVYLETLSENSDEEQLAYKLANTVELFESSSLDDDDGSRDIPFTGGVKSLYQVLRNSGTYSDQQDFKTLCYSPTKLSAMLRKLVRTHPQLVLYSEHQNDFPIRKHGAKYWIIMPPNTEEELTEESCI